MSYNIKIRLRYITVYLILLHACIQEEERKKKTALGHSSGIAKATVVVVVANAVIPALSLFFSARAYSNRHFIPLILSSFFQYYIDLLLLSPNKLGPKWK
jgi:hypothetical protein